MNTSNEVIEQFMEIIGIREQENGDDSINIYDLEYV
jgi:hypothetical protein